MPLVPGTYAPPALNPLFWPVGGPPIDNDPASPTYGQPTYSNVRPSARTPGYGTTSKGNPGQPAPSVPTNAQNSTSFVYQEPPAKPDTPPVNAEAPQQSPEDIIRGLKPQTDEQGTPAAAPAPMQAGAPDPATQTILDLKPQVDDKGKSTDNQPSLYSAQSPSAKAVGIPIAEDRVPGAEFQLAINASTDPAQRARTAAHQLGVPLDSIIIGPGGRMAAVDPQGQPYYIEPQQVFASDKSITKKDDGTWDTTPSFHVNPYATTSPLAPETSGSFDPANLVRGGAAELPNMAQSALIWGPTALAELYGGPTAAAATAGGMTSLTGAGRQYIANLKDPRRFDLAPDIVKGEDTRAAIGNALLTRAAPIVNKLFDPAFDILMNRPVAPATQVGSIPITRRQPYGNQDILAPWEAPQRWELPPGPLTPPGNPPGLPPPGARIQPPAIGEPTPEPGAATPPTSSAIPADNPAYTPQPRLVPGGALPGVAIPEEPPPLTSPIKTQADAEARADELIRHYYAGGNTTPMPGTRIPGHEGTLAQITGNEGGASLERTLRNEPPLANTFGEVDRGQNAAGQNAVLNLRGTMEDYAAADAAVNRATAAKKASTFSNTTPTSVEPTISTIDDLLKSPEAQGNPDIAAGLRETKNLFYKTNPQTGKPLLDQDGNPVLQTDPETLYMVRRTINDKISGLARDTDSKIRFAAGQMGPVKTQLDADIAAGAPEYPSYMQQVSEQKKPIEGQEYLLGRNLTNSAGDPTLGQVNATIRDVENQRYLKSGWQSADALTPDQLNQLYALRDTLQERANLQKGRAFGSNTAQNILGAGYKNALMGTGARAAGQVAGGIAGGLVGTFLDPITGGYAGAALGSPVGIGAARWVENKLTPNTAAGEAMLQKALLDRVLNIGGKGVRALSGGP